MATIWGTTERHSASSAALINAVATSALEFDSLNGNVHADAVALPAAMAAAERARCTGTEFLEAYVVGAELICRLGAAAAGRHKGWSYTSAFGVFGAAAAAARAQRLGRAATCDAFGLALSMAAGSQQANTERVLAKRLQPGIAARNGVFATDAAAAGFSGPRGSIDGKFGLGVLYEQLDLDVLLGGWNQLRLADTGIKKYPVCACSHAAIEACSMLRREHALDARDVVAVQVRSVAVHASDGRRALRRQGQSRNHGAIQRSVCVGVHPDPRRPDVGRPAAGQGGGPRRWRR